MDKNNEKHIENKKGRKKDNIRNYFRNEKEYMHCNIDNCNTKFSTNTSVSILKRHITNNHDQILNKNIKINNNMIENIEIIENDIYSSLAIAFSKNALSHSLIEDEYFKKALDIIQNNKNSNLNLNKKKLREKILEESVKVNNNVILKLASNKNPVTLVLDGWTNVRSNKVTNLLLISNGISYYYTSIENIGDFNTSDWLVPKLEEKINYLISKNINVIAISTDNENLMKCVCKKLKIIFPVLIIVPYSVHIIQLCLKETCKIDYFNNLIKKINSIIYSLRNNKENKIKLYQLQITDNIKEPLKILYYVNTRWTSLISSIERILILKKYIIKILNIEDDLCENLKIFYLFLKPFNTFTNQIQKDEASLYSVWTNFNKIIKYYNSEELDIKIKNNAKSIKKIIKNKWNDHINNNLINAVRLVNFEETFKASDESLKFIEEWGSCYLKTYDMVNDNVNNIEKIIYLQISEFLTKQKEFANIRNIILNLKQACILKNIEYNSKYVWGRFLNSHYELSSVAIALLSICPSEASVERSFSSLIDTHSVERNRLTNDIIEAEMTIKWNL